MTRPLIFATLIRMNFMCVLIVPLLCACASGREYFAGSNPGLPFSAAVRVGNTVYVSGHLGRDAQTKLPPADPADEARLVLDAFAASLAKAGLGMDDLVQVQVFCTDMALYATFNAAYEERFGDRFPARAFIGAGSLLFGCRFEVLGIAVD